MVITNEEPNIMDTKDCDICGAKYYEGGEYTGHLAYLTFEEEPNALNAVYKHVNICPTCVATVVSRKEIKDKAQCFRGAK